MRPFWCWRLFARGLMATRMSLGQILIRPMDSVLMNPIAGASRYPHAIAIILRRVAKYATTLIVNMKRCIHPHYVMIRTCAPVEYGYTIFTLAKHMNHHPF